MLFRSLTFKFTGMNGEELSATIDITSSMVDGRTTAEVTAAIVDALNRANFDDNTATGVDESKMKVSDLFTITANTKPDGTADATATGAIKIEGGANGGGVVAGLEMTKKDGSKVDTAKIPTFVTETAAAAGDAEVTTVAKGANNFTAGDVFRMTGKLSTGEDFSVELTAGKDFAIGTDYDATMKNIVDALNNGTDAAGNELKITEIGRAHV